MPSPIAAASTDEALATPPTRPWHEIGFQLRHWGWPFALGAGCLLVAGAVAMLWLPGLRREADALAAQADLADHRARAWRRQEQGAAPQPSGSQRFLAGFPASDTRQDRLAALFALAVERHLQLHPSEFKLTPERELGLMQYGVTMPLTGPYAQVRDFVAAAQARDPALGLDRLRLRRAAPGTAVVEADLAWTLYMRPMSDADLAGAPAVPASATR
jgi:hypothetical protein